MQHGNWGGGAHQGDYLQPPHQADDELAQRLHRVVDTRDSVTDCSRAMLQRTDIRTRCIRVWRDVFQSAVGEGKFKRNSGSSLNKSLNRSPSIPR